MKKLFVLLLLAGTTAWAGPNAALIQNVAKNVILQTYKDLNTNAQNLHAAVDALAAERTQARLTAAQDAWRATRVPWESSEAFLFGPVEALGIDPKIDTWPLNALDLERILSSNNALTPAFIRTIGANLQGFHTVEYLLFGNGVHTNQKTIGEMTPRQIEYLQATTTVLAENTALLASAWESHYDPSDSSTPSYSDILAKPSLKNRFYNSERAVLDELIRGMIKISDEVGTGKMSDPLGADKNSANPSLVESPFAWNSTTDFTNNIASVLHVYTGTYGNSQGPGIRDFVKTFDPALAARVEQKILSAMQKIQDVAHNEDYAKAIFDDAGRARAKAAIDELGQLKQMIESQVLPLLDK